MTNMLLRKLMAMLLLSSILTIQLVTSQTNTTTDPSSTTETSHMSHHTHTHQQREPFACFSCNHHLFYPNVSFANDIHAFSDMCDETEQFEYCTSTPNHGCFVSKIKYIFFLD